MSQTYSLESFSQSLHFLFPSPRVCVLHTNLYYHSFHINISISLDDSRSLLAEMSFSSELPELSVYHIIDDQSMWDDWLPLLPTNAQFYVYLLKKKKGMSDLNQRAMPYGLYFIYCYKQFWYQKRKGKANRCILFSVSTSASASLISALPVDSRYQFVCVYLQPVCYLRAETKSHSPGTLLST